MESVLKFSRMRRHLSTLLKVAVTLLGLAYIVWRVPVDEVIGVLSNVRWGWTAVAFLLVVASLFLRAFRWHVLLRGLDKSVSFLRLTELYFVGNFFNAFLPSGFGGDAVRIIEVARDVSGNIAAGTVILDRLTGLMMLFVLALLTLPFRPQGFPDTLAWTTALISILGLVSGFILLDGGILRRLGRWLPSRLSPAGEGPVARTLQAVHGCGWRAVASAFAISLLFNLLLVAWWQASGKALGLEISYRYYLLVVPIMSVALLVPSIGGLGVRENLAPLLFAGIVIEGPDAAAQSVALSLLVFLIMRLASLLGAPVYLMSVLRESKKRTASSSQSAGPSS